MDIEIEDNKLCIVREDDEDCIENRENEICINDKCLNKDDIKLASNALLPLILA